MERFHEAFASYRAYEHTVHQRPNRHQGTRRLLPADVQQPKIVALSFGRMHFIRRVSVASRLILYSGPPLSGNGRIDPYGERWSDPAGFGMGRYSYITRIPACLHMPGPEGRYGLARGDSPEKTSHEDTRAPKERHYHEHLGDLQQG